MAGAKTKIAKMTTSKGLGPAYPRLPVATVNLTVKTPPKLKMAQQLAPNLSY